MPEETSAEPVSASSPDDPPRTTSQRKASTVQRRRQERRDERLSHIRAQTADGSLVVRQMTVAEHEAATGVARAVRERAQARKKRY